MLSTLFCVSDVISLQCGAILPLATEPRAALVPAPFLSTQKPYSYNSLPPSLGPIDLTLTIDSAGALSSPLAFVMSCLPVQAGGVHRAVSQQQRNNVPRVGEESWLAASLSV